MVARTSGHRESLAKQDGRQAALSSTEPIPAIPPEVKRPYDHPRFMFGTSAFRAAGSAGNFYPAGMKSANVNDTTPREVASAASIFGCPDAPNHSLNGSV